MAVECWITIDRDHPALPREELKAMLVELTAMLHGTSTREFQFVHVLFVANELHFKFGIDGMGIIAAHDLAVSQVDGALHALCPPDDPSGLALPLP